MVGWVRLDRDVFEDEFFAKEPFSEREAWLWMLAKAAWKDTRHKVGSEMVAVPRGSFFATLRELQKEWRWKSDTKVRNFLKRTQAERKLRCETNAKKTQITICNYDNYLEDERTENAKKTQAARGNERTKVRNKQINNKPEDLFPEQISDAQPDPKPDPIEEGWEEFKTIWPKGHPRRAMGKPVREKYFRACQGKNAAASGPVTPDELNRAAKAYVASVKDLQYLSGTEPFLNGAKWENFFDIDPPEETNRHRELLKKYAWVDKMGGIKVPDHDEYLRSLGGTRRPQ